MTAPEHGAQPGFVAIYRWKVEPAQEEAFKAAWRAVTIEGRSLGSFGSCLTRDENGDFLAIALWPDEQARAAAFKQIAARSGQAGVARFDEIKLDVVDDLWTVSPFARQ